MQYYTARMLEDFVVQVLERPSETLINRKALSRTCTYQLEEL